MNRIDEIRDTISAELLAFEEIYNKVLDSDNSLLSNVHSYIMEVRGKRLRPIITILSAKLFGDVNNATLYSAFAIELLHTASLVHDDVVDDTTERRGRQSVNAKWNNKIAILSGDYILSKSLFSAVKTERIEILHSVSSIGMTLADGELLQLVNNIPSTTTMSEYIAIIKRKTAMLFASCAEVGGLSVRCSQEQLETLKSYGEYLGMCFQIKDDIFDYYNDANIGKPTCNDVRDGKVTLPLIYALSHSTKEESEKIAKWIDNKEFSKENIAEITQFAHSKGGVEYAIEVMEEYKQKALEQLTNLPKGEVRDAMSLCLDFVTSRNF